MINLTPKVWQQREMPGPPLSLGGDMKHGRMIFNPDDGRVWNFGGDWNQTVGSGCQEVYSYDVAQDDGLGNGLGWTFEDPYCPAPGTYKYGQPDQITTVYDTSRNLVWLIPGYMPNNSAVVETVSLAVALAQGGSETTISVVENISSTGGNRNFTPFPSSALAIVNDDLTVEYILYDGLDVTVQPHKFLNVQRGFGGTPKGAHAVGENIARTGHAPCGPRTTVRSSLPYTSFSFDCSTKEWKVRGKIRRNLQGQSPGSSENSSNGFYDEQNDKIIRITGSSPIDVRTFNLPDLSFTTKSFSSFSLGGGLNSVPIGNNDIAWDPDGRKAYIIQPGTNPSTMLRYDPDTETMVKITGTGVPPRFTIAQSTTGINCFYPKWDSINKKILWPFVYNFSSGSAFPTDDPAIDPTSPTHTCDLWIYHPTTNTWEHDAMNPGPPIFPQGNTWVFNPKENCLMGTGKTNDPGYVYLYRYASTSPAHRPVGLQTALR